MTTSDVVKCWGWNAYGQLGDGTTTTRSTPVDVSGLTSGVVQVSPGLTHTCAVTTSGGAKCWGRNNYGQLGDGTTTDRSTPVDVSGLTSGVASISAGGDHTCAVMTSGGVKCWGLGWYGLLGDGTATTRSTPGDVLVSAGGVALTGIAQISTGRWHTCAVTTSGGVKCWAGNSNGRLGDGTTTDRYTPVDVSGLTSGVASIDASDGHTCARMTSGGAKCWGRNNYGVLGDGTTTDRSTPVDVLATGQSAGSAVYLGGVASIDVGWDHTCALMTSGGVKCWGYNWLGRLGDGTTTNRSTPVDVSGLTSGVALLNVGAEHTCVVTTSDVTRCWGRNAGSQLGDGTTTDRSSPVNVTGLTGNPGWSAAVTVTVTATSGSTASTSVTLTRSPGAPSITSITAGDQQLSVAFTAASNSGSAITTYRYSTDGGSTWRDRASGTTASPLVITTISGVANTALVNGTAYQVRIRAVNAAGDGIASSSTSATPAVPELSYASTAFTTGTASQTRAPTLTGGTASSYSYSGTLPTGVSFNTTTGVFTGPAAWNFDAAQIATGDGHTCARTTSGGVKCWGLNYRGQLGDGTTTDRTTPVDVLATGQSAGSTTYLTGVASIAAGWDHTCALMTSGGVKCWGSAAQGQLGYGGSSHSSTPVDVSGLTSGVASVSAGTNHTCAVTTSGGVKCWGLNSGQLGDGTTTLRYTPVDVLATGQSAGSTTYLTGVSAIFVRNSQTCARTTSGGVKCWGYNTSGQLGDGTTTDRRTPTDVLATGQSAGSTTYLTGVASVSAGDGHTCAVTTSGGVKCWGLNSGRLGDGTTTVRYSPVDVLATGQSAGSTTYLTGVASVSAGTNHTCAVTTSGGVKCWGSNVNGQLGDATSSTRRTPVDVLATGQSAGSTTYLTGVSAIFVRNSQTCARTTSGGVKCWGYNTSGQLGDGTTTDRRTPTDVLATGQSAGSTTYLTGVASVSAGTSHTCAVTTSGGVKCWGLNSRSQLGDGTTTQRTTPVDVSGLGNPGWPASITVTVTATSGLTGSANVTLTRS